jgi:hypothetical protein
MGLRLRLKAGVDVGGFPGQARVILQAMRTYGLVVADNGSSGFIGGVPDERWDNDALHQLGRVTLADFEAVDTAPLRVSPASAAFRTTPARPATTRPAATRRAGPAPALLPGVGRRSFMPEPQFPPASPEATPDPALDAVLDAAARADGPRGSGSPAVLPQILAAILGVIAAALAFRQVTLHSRRGRHPAAGRHAQGSPAGRDARGSRHARTGTGPSQDQAGPAPPGPHQVPPDPDPAGSRRP